MTEKPAPDSLYRQGGRRSRARELTRCLACTGRPADFSSCQQAPDSDRARQFACATCSRQTLVNHDVEHAANGHRRVSLSP